MRRGRPDHGDPERIQAPPPVAEQLAGTMFDAAGWPEAPQVSPAEQRGLLLESQGGIDREPVEVRYARWRRTPDGEATFAEIERRVIRLAHQGAPEIRVKGIGEDLRKEGQSVNNSYLSQIARELHDAYPLLHGRMEFREAPSRRKDAAA